MNGTTATLSRLRWLFVIYFAAQLIVDLALGWDLAAGALGRGFGLGRWHLSQGAFLTLILLTEGALLALGVWLFQQLIKRRNWARIVLLIVGWLAVLDALSSWLFSAQTAGLTPWLNRLEPGLDWHRAMVVDHVKDLLGLLFWGYSIVVLQFNAGLKRDFVNPPPAPGAKTGQ